MMFGLHETMQSRMHVGLKEEPSLLAPPAVGVGAGAGAMQHLMHHHHHHHHVPSVRNWMQPSVVDQAAALARYDHAYCVTYSNYVSSPPSPLAGFKGPTARGGGEGKKRPKGRAEEGGKG